MCEKYTCDVCGREAVQWLRDLSITLDINKSRHILSYQKEPLHYFCEHHARNQKVTVHRYLPLWQLSELIDDFGKEQTPSPGWAKLVRNAMENALEGLNHIIDGAPIEEIETP